MTPAERIIVHLDGVKELKPRKWVALCPAHDDRNPFLAVAETDDKRVLMHCWAGCEAADIMHALGLSLSDLFDHPPKESDKLLKRQRSLAYAAAAALKSVSADALMIVIAAENVADGVMLTAADRDCLIAASRRVHLARELVQ
jgi:hypothetical protein